MKLKFKKKMNKEIIQAVLDDFCTKSLHYKGVPILENQSLLIHEYLSSNNIGDVIKEAGQKSVGILSNIIESYQRFGILNTIINMKKDAVCNTEELSNMKDMIMGVMIEAEKFLPPNECVYQCENEGGDDSL